MQDTPNQRRLAAILAADVVSYTKLVEQDTDGTVTAWKSARDDVIKPLVGKNSGRIIKFTGDGFLVEFPSVQDAVSCAIALQIQLVLNPLNFRMGINVGDITDDGGDVHGEGVNIAARLEALAEPGGVCISGDVYNQVLNRIDAVFNDMGEQEVKNVSRPVRVYSIASDARTTTETSVNKPQENDARPSIAVLPFDNMSGDPEQEYFSDGITEDIITELSRFSWLLVIARSSSFHYKGRLPNIRDVGRELNVQYVLEGSLRRSANRVRINAQLIDAEAGDHIWAERFDRELEDVFAVQDEVTERVVSTVAGSLMRPSERRSSRKHPSNLTAYELLLRGKEHFQRNTKPENLLAREYFLKAIELTPEYGLAHTWLGWTHFYDHELGWSDDSDKSSVLGLSSIRRAAELDPLDAWAQAGLAYGYSYSRQYDLAETHIEKALKLNPNDADILALKGLLLTFFGRLNDSIEALERARLRNPFALDWYLWCLGIALYTSGKYERAITAWREMPHIPTEVYACLAASYAQIGQLTDAQECLAEFHQRCQNEFANYPQEDREEWQRYWIKSFPYQNTEHLDHLLDGLRKAGLPV